MHRKSGTHRNSGQGICAVPCTVLQIVSTECERYLSPPRRTSCKQVTIRPGPESRSRRLLDWTKRSQDNKSSPRFTRLPARRHRPRPAQSIDNHRKEPCPWCNNTEACSLGNGDTERAAGGGFPCGGQHSKVSGALLSGDCYTHAVCRTARLGVVGRGLDKTDGQAANPGSARGRLCIGGSERTFGDPENTSQRNDTQRA
jgi:hypothetical protein